MLHQGIILRQGQVTRTIYNLVNDITFSNLWKIHHRIPQLMLHNLMFPCRLRTNDLKMLLIVFQTWAKRQIHKPDLV